MRSRRSRRIHTQFATDLYLQNTSQDKFTVFSPFYAFFIGRLGLETAARSLALIFSGWILVAAWSLARAIADKRIAWLCVAFLMIVPSDYGGFGVFRYFDQFLTARLPAEALIVTALACHFRGMKTCGLAIAIGSLLVHPLIALPGCLLLISLWVPKKVTIVGALVGVLLILSGSIAATVLPTHLLTLMDKEWLNVVQERSQFLFPQLWSFRDWDLNVRPFGYLALSSMIIQDDRVRKLCTSAMLIGAAGLAVALIGSLVGPVAVLVQGQAWRWMWISGFIAALLLPLAAWTAWRDEKCGRLVALLLLAGWTAWPCTAFVASALILWLFRRRIEARASAGLRFAAAALSAVIIVWVLVKSISILMSAPAMTPSGLRLEQLRQIFALRITALMLVVLIWRVLRDSRTPWIPAIISVMAIACVGIVWPASFRHRPPLESSANLREFSDWERVIPPAATVLVTPSRDVGQFVWFTLERPNYLSVDQSAGVVFSRATALEVERRSQVLLPLMQPNWKIKSTLRAGAHRNPSASNQPLTARILKQICADPVLGFVIAPQDVGFNPVGHTQTGPWRGWNLYDCRRVRT